MYPICLPSSRKVYSFTSESMRHVCTHPFLRISKGVSGVTESPYLTFAPVKPYTEFIDTLYANCLPLYISFNAPVDCAISFLACLRNCFSSKRILGKRLGTSCANL